MTYPYLGKIIVSNHYGSSEQYVLIRKEFQKGWFSITYGHGGAGVCEASQIIPF